MDVTWYEGLREFTKSARDEYNKERDIVDKWTEEMSIDDMEE